MQLVCTKRLPRRGEALTTVYHTSPNMRKEPLPDILAFFARCCRCQPEALHGKSCAFIIRAEQPKREGKAGAAGCFILCKLESEPKTGAEGRGLRAAVGLRDVSQPRVLGARTGGGDARTLICPPGREKARADGLAHRLAAPGVRHGGSRSQRTRSGAAAQSFCTVCSDAQKLSGSENSTFHRRLDALRVFFRDGVYKGGPRKLYCLLPCASAPVWDTLAQEDLLELLQTPGWHSAYDARAGGAYLVYDGPDNPFDRWFLSVETARSLGQKLDLLRNADLAGIIVWEASLDTKNHSFAAQLRDTLLK